MAEKKKKKQPKTSKDLPLAIVKQMITLSTSGFGLVAALAWNEFVKAFVESYIKPYLPAGSHILTLFIYASVITVLAVTVTLQLTRLQQRLEDLATLIRNRKKTKSETKGS